MSGRILLNLVLAAAMVGAIGVAWFAFRAPRSGHILDEALSANPRREAASFHAADKD